MKARGLLAMAIVIGIVAVAVMAIAKIGPATVVANLLIWVFNALGAILEGFIDAFAPWRR